MQITSVVGNRPQFIKAAAVSGLLRAEHEEVLVHTGQHYDKEMSQVFFDELELPQPDRQLACGSGARAVQIAAIMSSLEAVLEESRPDLVLVYGDTNSTLAAALTAAKLSLPLAHVEAGMRSFDRTMPEEINRILTDHCSDILLCSSQTAVQNLGSEGIDEGVCLVGDVMVDVALSTRETDSGLSLLERLGLEPREYLLLTAHRPANVDSAGALEKLIELVEDLPQQAVFPLHPRTRAKLAEFGLMERLEQNERVLLQEPLGYFELMQLLRSANALLTDSGGLQKEAYVFAVPCVTLRDTTEWIETIETGWNQLVGLDRQAALVALKAKRPSAHPELYGNGKAAQAIVKAISEQAHRLMQGRRVEPAN